MFEEIQNRRNAIRDNILKGFETDIEKSEEDELEKAKHQIGDVHPNGKWTWVQLPNGKCDWRNTGGRAHKRHEESQKNKEAEGKKDGEPKTTEEHAAETDTAVLKKVAADSGTPQKLKDAAKKELSKRDKGDKQNPTPISKPEKKEPKPKKSEQTESTQTNDGVKTMNAPRTVNNLNSLEKWAKGKYSTVKRGNSWQDSGNSNSVDYCYVKDKKGNVFTVAFTSNNDYDNPTKEMHIIPGQHSLTLDKEGKIKKGRVHRLDKI